MTDEDRSDTRTEDDYEEQLEEAYDDEGTLDEEEMLNPGENYQDELKMLEDDANLSIEELRQKYYGGAAAAAAAAEAAAVAAEEEYDDTQSASTSDDARKSDEADDMTANADVSEADMAGPSSVSSPKKDEKEHGYFSDVDDNEEDTDYVPPDPWRRYIRQGAVYQASVPDSISTGPSSPRADREVLLWTPYKLPMKEVEEYLKHCYDRALQINDPSASGDTQEPGNSGRHFPLKDDEDALKALLDAKFSTNAALATYPFARANAPLRSIGPNPARWTDEECECFEKGMGLHYKQFHAIKKEFLPHRTVGEIVQFYYIWKKTERHDMLRQNQNPNCTDFMEGFVKQMDYREGGQSNGQSDENNLLGIAANAIPADVDQIASREWGRRWQNGEGAALPHLDSDTITNVLQ